METEKISNEVAAAGIVITSFVHQRGAEVGSDLAYRVLDALHVPWDVVQDAVRFIDDFGKENS